MRDDVFDAGVSRRFRPVSGDATDGSDNRQGGAIQSGERALHRGALEEGFGQIEQIVNPDCADLPLRDRTVKLRIAHGAQSSCQ